MLRRSHGTGALRAGGTPAAACSAAETWGKFPSESVSTGRWLRAAPRRPPPAWRGRAAASPPPGATGWGPALVQLHLSSAGVGRGPDSLPLGPGRCRSRSGSGAARVPLLWAARRRSRAGTAASAPAGAGTAGGGREFLSRPVLWVMEGVPGKRSLASGIWRNSFLHRNPLFCVDLDLKSRAGVVD